MRYFDLRIIILGLIIAGLIFTADMIFGLGAISIGYIFFLLITFWLAQKKQYIFSSIVISIILTLIGWSYQVRVYNELIDVGIVKAQLDYEGLFRVFTIIILIFVGGVLFRQRMKEEELHEFNETLELRILARSAASEAKAKRLEQQILILQDISKHEVSESLSKLDNVIKELKEVSEGI
jgi:signal transduction histidine kinase